MSRKKFLSSIKIANGLAVVTGTIGLLVAIASITVHTAVSLDDRRTPSDRTIANDSFWRVTVAAGVGPYLVASAGLLSFAAFSAQIATNKNQSNQIRRQERELADVRKRQRFEGLENRIFRILDNLQTTKQAFTVKEMVLRDQYVTRKGSEAINALVRVIDHTVDDFMSSNESYFHRKVEEKIKRTAPRFVTAAAYSRVLKGDRMSTNDVERIPEAFGLDGFDEEFIGRFRNVLSKSTNRLVDVNRGFEEFLSPFFRQLYQAYRLLSEYDAVSNDESGTRSIARVIRSSTSPTDQQLLYYSLLFGYQRTWEDDKIVSRYKPIKNIPLRAMSGYRPDLWLQEDFGITKDELGDHLEDIELGFVVAEEIGVTK